MNSQAFDVIIYSKLKWMKLGYKQKNASPIADLLAFRKVVPVLI